MKKLICISIFLLLLSLSHAQTFDLIVTNKKDSIACKIDSITDKYIYIEMIHNNHWIHTMYNKEGIIEYKKNAVDMMLYKFKDGTSYIYTNTKNYDLIVTTAKDSLGVHIDSISDTHIHIEMLNKGVRIKSMIKKESVLYYKKHAVSKKHYKFKAGTSYITKKVIQKGYKHGHRIFFAPTPRSINKTDFYFTTHAAMVYSLQYGFTDNFSVDFGTSILAVPWYVMLNYSFPISDKFAVSIGNIAVFDIWLLQGLWGNMTYGLTCFGSPEKQLNIGPGFLHLSGNLTRQSNSPAFTISGQWKLGKQVYFITEHYYSSINQHFDHYYHLPGSTEENRLTQDYEYNYDNYFIGGITGIRVTGNRYPNIAWQFGIIDMIIIDENKVPVEYQNLENHLDDGKLIFNALPIISFSYRFGQNF